MGEVSEMIMEGILCQECGEYLEHSQGSFPQFCKDCTPKESEDEKDKEK